MLSTRSFHYGTFLIILLFLIFTAGCDGDEQSFDITTDEAFHQAVEQSIDQYYKNNDSDIIYNYIDEIFFSRYGEEQVREFVQTRLEEEQELFNSRVNELEQVIKKVEEEIAHDLTALKERSDEATIEKLKNHLEPLYAWIESLDQKLAEDPAPERIIELLEEKKHTLEELAGIIKEHDNNEHLQINKEGLEQEELYNYYLDVESILDKDASITEGYLQVSGENFISDQVLHDELRRNIVPDSERLKDKLIRIRIDNDDIAELHNLLEQSWEYRVNGFKLLARSIREKDEELREEAEQAIDQGFRFKERYLQDLNVYLEE